MNESIYCSQCGTENPASSNFCSKCGTNLKSSDEYTEDSVVSEEISEEIHPKSKKKLWIILGISITAIALILFLLFPLNGILQNNTEYDIGELTYKSPSSWEFKVDGTANYHYPSTGGMLFSAYSSVPSPDSSDQAYELLAQSYDGFLSPATDITKITDNYKTINKMYSLSATLKADFSGGTQYIDYYSVIYSDNVYIFALAGTPYNEKQQDKIFDSIVSTITTNENDE